MLVCELETLLHCLVHVYVRHAVFRDAHFLVHVGLEFEHAEVVKTEVGIYPFRVYAEVYKRACKTHSFSAYTAVLKSSAVRNHTREKVGCALFVEGEFVLESEPKVHYHFAKGRAFLFNPTQITVRFDVDMVVDFD